MAGRIYTIHGCQSKRGARGGRPNVTEADPRDLHTLAEAERRRTIIRACRIIERAERRDRDDGK